MLSAVRQFIHSNEPGTLHTPTFWPSGIGMALRWTGDPRTPEMKARWNELQEELSKRKMMMSNT